MEARLKAKCLEGMAGGSTTDVTPTNDATCSMALQVILRSMAASEKRSNKTAGFKQNATAFNG
jgi:hypothetical protein